MKLFPYIIISGIAVATIVLESCDKKPAAAEGKGGPSAQVQAAAKAKRVRAQAALKEITLGIKNYLLEYNRYPLPPGHISEEPIPLSEGATILKILLGRNEQKMNPREIAFIEPPVYKDGAGGLVGIEGNYAFNDPWGNPYLVIVDANYDSKIANPDLKNEDATISGKASPYLVIGVAALSFGEDGKQNTKDDVVSWRN